mmetsp:Transcript_10244/g.30572  ORF Transcript_10244/g.30572 Transcript_10244/m.30572 type:complete len:445 (+) Transcript_10244:1418-2752(+)
MHVGRHHDEELAVHAVHDAAVAGDERAEVLDVVGALDGRCEEAAPGRDERRNQADDEAVRRRQRERHAEDVDLLIQPQRVVVRAVEVVSRVEQARREVEVVHGAAHEVEAREELREEVAEDERHEGRAHEALPRLVRAERRQEGLLDELLPEGDAAHVGEGVVGHDGGRRHHEPEEAVEDVAHRALELRHDEHDGRHAPAEVRHLVADELSLQGRDGADEDAAEEHEGDGAVVPQHGQQPVQPRLAEGEVAQPLAVGVEDRHREPAPLRGAEERDLELARGVVAHVHELQVERALDHQDHGGHVEVPRCHHRQECSDHGEAEDRALADLLPLLLPLLRFLRREGSVPLGGGLAAIVLGRVVDVVVVVFHDGGGPLLLRLGLRLARALLLLLAPRLGARAPPRRRLAHAARTQTSRSATITGARPRLRRRLRRGPRLQAGASARA